MDLDLSQYSETDRRVVDPPIQVETAMWSKAGQLDWWVKERQEWLGRVRGADGRQRWIRAVDLRLSGRTRQTSAVCLTIRLAVRRRWHRHRPGSHRQSGESLWIAMRGRVADDEAMNESAGNLAASLSRQSTFRFGSADFLSVPAGRESVGLVLCVTDLRDNATSWGMYVAQLGDRRQVRTIR
jgi:hypothetical protein